MLMIVIKGIEYTDVVLNFITKKPGGGHSTTSVADVNDKRFSKHTQAHIDL